MRHMTRKASQMHKKMTAVEHGFTYKVKESWVHEPTDKMQILSVHIPLPVIINITYAHFDLQSPQTVAKNTRLA